MKLNKALLAAAIVMGMSSMAHAADQGSGKVTFTGAIIDSPCSINPDSLDQTIDLGRISNVALASGGKSSTHNFAINLEGCSFGTPATNNKVTVTFTGEQSAAVDGALGITGSAQGAGVMLTEENGALVTLGQATKPQILHDGDNTLGFAAYLQGAKASDAIVPGDFTSVANFTLAYN
ncbi:fimbrial protein [Serratia marcescens]|uniref:fimbrial protein n=1 Tax=Serratia marcescens TaxID=615 RepID=UPI0007C93B60|nr:fimbrial protein [Serratia marcescens]OAH32812.1 fimbria A protein [Serratia marcescens]